ncbi:Superoxide dismutase [Mn], mitochondrial [Venturia inaequalis]|uniref:Superoxide dismutase n=1 Tax=Venturia inaequalis TaxID=5025 RepID=A0A8H3YR44_VENIN|nr:Superoxide dismutase [Mn], mitochondrial [Venturia inaequalis]KAE9966890.1 hypothetical protein EG328_008538 [Venturia inaequalis]KAE9993633.1 hypothetical protein EG327_004154 [Venturia inaequalis]
MAEQTYSLPKLPYAYDALEPVISKQIMELHHSKHHQTYVTNLNNLVGTLKSAEIPAQIASQPAFRFHAGGHINHTLFWRNLTPPSSPEASSSAAPKLSAAIKATWGSEDAFKKEFNAELLGIQGSGWGWLVKDESKGDRLSIVTTKDQDPVVGKGQVPVFGVDMWEHAYYLQYLNGKAAYVENIWKVINWKESEVRYTGKREDVFKALKSVM